MNSQQFFPSREERKLDRYFIREALKEAKKAAFLGEIPIGAIAVSADNQIIARAHNLKETTGDPTAHAELLVLRAAGADKNHRRLQEITLYTTLEPCPMCAGAMVLARIKRLVYGAYDPKAGAAGSMMNLLQDRRLNHRLEVTAGVLENECSTIIKDFFRERRQ